MANYAIECAASDSTRLDDLVMHIAEASKSGTMRDSSRRTLFNQLRSLTRPLAPKTFINCRVWGARALHPTSLALSVAEH